MFKGKPILTGNSDLNQAQLIFNLVGTPTEENMPGWSALPGCEGVKNFGNKSGNLSQVFKECVSPLFVLAINQPPADRPASPTSQGPLAISLLSELLKLDWRRRINAIDALKHPYFTTEPLPAKPGDLPHFEDSHEFDRRQFRSQRPRAPGPPNDGAGEGRSGSHNSRIPGAARGMRGGFMGARRDVRRQPSPSAFTKR